MFSNVTPKDVKQSSVHSKQEKPKNSDESILAQRHIKKVALVTGRFPPAKTMTYAIQEILALKTMGLEIAIFPMLAPLEDNQITLPADFNSPVYKLPLDIKNGKLFLELLDKYAIASHQVKLRDELLAYLYNDSNLISYVSIIMNSLDLFLGTQEFIAARKTLNKVLQNKISPNNRFTHELHFIQGLIIANVMIKNNIYIAYAQNATRPPIVAQYAATFVGKQAIWGLQGHNNDTTILSNDEISHRYNESDFLVVESNACKLPFKKVTGEDKKIQTVARGIDLSQFKKPKNPRSISTGSKHEKIVHVVCVARAIDKKGVHVLIDAIAKIPANMNFKLTYIGEGELLDKLKLQAKDLKVENKIEFRGSIPHYEIVRVMQESDINIAPSVQLEDSKLENIDGLPVAIIEAAATGLTTISTDVGGAGDFIKDQVNGLIVSQNNSSALADAITRLIKNPKLRLQLGEEAYKVAHENYDYTTSQRGLLKIMQNIAENKLLNEYTLLNWIKKHSTNVKAMVKNEKLLMTNIQCN